MTKECMILTHLIEHGSITSMYAINEYGVTRLAACIFNLKAQGHKIRTVTETGKDRFGNSTHFARYVYEGELNGK